MKETKKVRRWKSTESDVKTSIRRLHRHHRIKRRVYNGGRVLPADARF